jgi:hypothetical protein
MKAVKKKVDPLSENDQVTAHIQKLDPEVGKIVQYLRELILNTDREINERIKWNNPSFYYTGEMKASDPKEYKRDIIVFNLFKGRIMLVFPTGAEVKDPAGLLQGDYKDGRRITTFKDMDDVKSKKKALQQVIKRWLELVDR